MISRMVWHSAALGAALALVGCNAALPSPDASVPQTIALSTHCPALHTYSADEAKEMGREMKALPNGSPLAAYVVEFRNIRRACGHQ